MKYTGKKNTECGSCSGNIYIPHPMTFRIDAVVHTSHLWCDKCFQKSYNGYVQLMSGGMRPPDPDTVAKLLQKETTKAFTPPKGYYVTGFWLATYEDGKVGFDINFEAKENE